MVVEAVFMHWHSRKMQAAGCRQDTASGNSASLQPLRQTSRPAGRQGSGSSREQSLERASQSAFCACKLTSIHSVRYSICFNVSKRHIHLG